jgi:hypothetical protein
MVIAPGHKHPIHRAHLVTGIARRSRRYVPNRFSTGLNPVMAAHAGAGCYSLMFEGCAHPANRPMAAVAGHGRRNVSGRLADRCSLVMAFGAGSRNHAVMCKECRCPICRSMAAVTVDRSRQVVRRFKGRYDSTAG